MDETAPLISDEDNRAGDGHLELQLDSASSPEATEVEKAAQKPTN